jgi:N-acetylglucosaminyldiphosphoundecaprenol N-acetyl-beta-D-mannosaminyltransferase
MSNGENILGYSVTTLGVEDCVRSILSHISIGDSVGWLACLNPHSYATSLKDREFSAALQDADWLVPDGIGVVLASAWLGGQIRTRITGSDIFVELQRQLPSVARTRVFLLGSTEAILESVALRIERDFPGVEVVGTFSPPFKSCFSNEENQAMISAVNSARVDVLWVAMTAPKQEKWLYQHRSQLNVRFAAAIGAVFDFYSGRVRRSHPAFQRLGLEWLPRLLQEPRRLWRRMFLSAPIFIWHVLWRKGDDRNGC